MNHAPTTALDDQPGKKFHDSGVSRCFGARLRTGTRRRVLCCNSATKHRHAFTLFELIIVLAVLVAVTAMAAPAMMDRIRSGQVQDAAEKIREVLAAARVYAIDTGVDYHFRYEIDGHNVIAIPAEQNQLIGNSNDSDGETSDFFYRSSEVPETIFLRSSRGGTSGSESLKSTAFGNLPNAGDLASKNWSSPILFRFDGSAEDTTFRVVDEDQRSCDVRVRGLTGAISISNVFIMEDE